jgi:hemolysin III
MGSIDKLNTYSKKEELLNIYSHGFGFVTSLVGFVLLILKSITYASFWDRMGFLVFGLSLLILYAASTLYHKAIDPIKRLRLKVFDHAAIFVLIAGSYSPFCIVGLKGSALGWKMFIIVWVIAFTGIIFKLFFTGKLKHVSTIMYVLMGWLVVFFIKPLMASLSEISSDYLILGGVFYTIGAILYSIKKIPYNHAIFHVFVLLGSFSHFWAIYNL